jgi:hypothetical protein
MKVPQRNKRLFNVHRKKKVREFPIPPFFYGVRQNLAWNLISGYRLFNSVTACTAKTLYQKLKTNSPEKKLRGHSPKFHIHMSVSDLCIPTLGLPIL